MAESGRQDRQPSLDGRHHGRSQQRHDGEEMSQVVHPRSAPTRGGTAISAASRVRRKFGDVVAIQAGSAGVDEEATTNHARRSQSRNAVTVNECRNR